MSLLDILYTLSNWPVRAGSDSLSRPTLAFVSHLRITGLDCHLDHLYEIFPRILARAVELGIDIWFGSELWSLLGANP